MPYLIDGHNVIAAMESIELEDPDDEAKLVLRLRSWFSSIRKKAVVVFDGGIPGGLSRTLSTTDVRVVFAARHHTIADRIIHERLRSLPDAPNWTVVSSDREVLDAARATGARTVSAQDFAATLEQPPEAEKEKPDTISAAEVDAWLQVFPEPAPKPTPQPSRVARKSTTGSQRSRGKKALTRPTRPSPTSPPVRTSRPIGDQMGLDVEVPKDAGSAGKPEEISNHEVEAWLQVFHDDPNSQIPPPNIPTARRRKAPPKPQEAVVRKTGALSSDEVDAWLAVFSDESARATPDDRSASPADVPADRNTGQRRKVSATLARHHENLAPTDGSDKADVSEEDLELWHRLFGEE